MLAASDSVATVSSMMHGEYGVDDVCLSVLSLVGPNGVQGKVPMHLTDEEVEKLQASANKLKGRYRSDRHLRAFCKAMQTSPL